MSTIKSSDEHLTLNADGSGKDIKFQSNGSEVASISDGGVVTATSYAGSGANLTGISSVGGATGVDFNDSIKARFGTGNDLEIYHDGTHSYIKDVGTGDLRIKGTELSLRSDSADEPYINCTENAGVSIFHNNVKKFETTADGATVSGALTATAGSGAIVKVEEGGGSLMFMEAGGNGSHLKFKAGHYLNIKQDDNNNYLVLNDNHTIDNYGTSGNWQRMMYAGGTGTQYYHSFRLSNNTQVGYINTDGSSTSYNTSSDYRLKENVDYTWDATTRLKQLKPARFNWIADETNTVVDGFIAHEVEGIVPEAISGEKDAMEAAVLYKEGDDIPEGKSVGDVKFAEQISPQSIDQAKLVP